MSTMIASPEERERGYRAAAKMVEKFLRMADKERPKRWNRRKEKTAAYREGYHAGLLFAHCMHAYGAHPLVPENAFSIANILLDDDAGAARQGGAK